MMKKSFSIIAGVLSGVIAATPVMAQGQACLQHNRMQSWRALDNRTLIFTDLDRHHYRVTMTPACRGVTDPQAHLVFHTWINLQCLPAGEIVSVRSPVFGLTSCAVDNVQIDGPFLPGYGSSG
jgi:hypothetical protein